MVRVPDFSRRHAGAVVVLVLAVVVVGAGTGVLPPGDDGAADPDPGPDPTPVPDADEIDLPTGINETGVEDGAVLMRSHREYLAERGFEFTVNHSLDRGKPNTPDDRRVVMTDVSKTVAATANVSAHRVVRHERSGGSGTETSWSNGSAGVRRIENGEVRYESYGYAGSPRLAHHYVLTQWFRPEYWNLSGVQADGDVVLRANVTHDFDTTREQGVPHVVRGRAVVAPEGYVSSFRIHVSQIPRRWRARDDIAMLKNRTLTYRILAVGNVSVPPPDWIDEALRATSVGEGSAAIAPVHRAKRAPPTARPAERPGTSIRPSGSD